MKKQQKVHKKPSRKLNGMCISRMKASITQNGEVKVIYIATHCGHSLSQKEIIHLPVPRSMKESIARKLSDGIPIDRILDGKAG